MEVVATVSNSVSPDDQPAGGAPFPALPGLPILLNSDADSPGRYNPLRHKDKLALWAAELKGVLPEWHLLKV